MTHLAICYITLFCDVTTSQPASQPVYAHAFALFLSLFVCVFVSLRSREFMLYIRSKQTHDLEKLAWNYSSMIQSRKVNKQ